MRVTQPRIGLGAIRLYDLSPPADSLHLDVVLGLGDHGEKRMPPKYIYDERGAALFEQICTLEAYYPTRTEIGILREHIGEMAESIGPACRLIEFGSGSGIKTQILLEHLEAPAAYMPIDISRTQLLRFAEGVAERYPGLEVLPVCADYTRPFVLPRARQPARRTVAFFPGSSIGNFEPAAAEAFLRQTAELCGPGGALLIGTDLRKDPAVIERAYNDPEGVTAAFNLNLLERINRECGADFDLSAFRHFALYDEQHGRIEMRLVSQRKQSVRLPAGASSDAPLEILFDAGEHITSEYSYKYSPEGFRELASRAGWAAEHLWTDEQGWFGEWLLTVA